MSVGRIILLYDPSPGNGKAESQKLKATAVGTVRKLLVKEGDVVQPGYVFSRSAPFLSVLIPFSHSMGMYPSPSLVICATFVPDHMFLLQVLGSNVVLRGYVIVSFVLLLPCGSLASENNVHSIVLWFVTTPVVLFPIITSSL